MAVVQSTAQVRHSLIDSILRRVGRMAFIHPGGRIRAIRTARTLLRIGDHKFTEPFFGATYPGHTGAMSPTIFLEVSRHLVHQAGGVEGFLALFPAGYQAFGIDNVFREHVRLAAFDLDTPSDKNVLLVRRPAHEAALRAAGHLKGV